MTLSEMKTIAAETLAHFIRTMPDVPFAGDDVIIEFAYKGKMAERARIFCEKYVPDKIINEPQAKDLESKVDANALIGRFKSAIVARIDRQKDADSWKFIIFHELMHIYCSKLEMDGEHFIDIYGSGTTPENPSMSKRP